jgi:putative membrane protein
MPSDRRLHPLSIVFGLVAQLRTFAIPGILVLVSAGAAGWGWQLWAMPFLIPYALFIIVRYISFRYRYEENELVIRSGLIFRNERHIPYARVQNLDAVQNVFHRLFKVVEVRVETGGGQEPEAKMSVLPVADFEEMRRRVFAGRGGEVAPAGDAAEAPALEPSGRTLLHLPPRELLLCGFLENRGFVILAAAFGLLWEVGLIDRLFGQIFGEPKGSEKPGYSVVRALVAAVFGRGELPLGRIALALAAFAGFLLFIRLLSMVWALVRLYDFRITRIGEDLRTRFGLLTRIVTTIPLRRIQTLTILEGPLYRLFKRASVRAETAGGGGEGGEESGKKQREWLAPVLRCGELAGFLREVMPELDLASVTWQSAHPRAYRRELKGWLIVATGISVPFVVLLKWWHLSLLAILFVWCAIAVRFYVKQLGWAMTDGAVLFRSGWIWRKITIARFTKIQAVAIHESPFDRRAVMARVRVDTAGAGDSSHRVDIPYLPRDVARHLCDLLTAQAARTAFRW